MEYYSSLKRKGILSQDTTGMNLEDTGLSEIQILKYKTNTGLRNTNIV